MARVLVVDDDPSLLRVLRVGLRARGHEVSVASNGEQGISQAALLSPDVIVLDLGLPDIDGLTVCRRIRGWSDVPIVVLSANDAEDRKVAALNEGADDYVTKPFGMAELEARIRTAIRHQRVEPDSPGATVITVGGVSIDLVHHEAHVKGRPVRLTSKEFGVLSFLMRNEEKVCTHEMILTAVWGASYARESQYLHVYVNRIRQKLGENSGVFLRAVPGIGYVLTTKDE
jgi:two-component system, OmpR family, KDP operon response regulator KdpE